MKTVSCIVFVLWGVALASRSTTKEPDIRSIDFKNFSFSWDNTMEEPPSYDASPWHWLKPLPQSRIQVVDGTYHFHGPHASSEEKARTPFVRVDAVVRGDLDGDGREEAAVHLNYRSGGTQNWDYLYVYRIAHGQPELMGILKSGERGYGGLGQVAIQDGLLVLDFADPERRVGDCCSEGYIRVLYLWQNGAFVEKGPRGRGDVNLNDR